MRKIFFAIILLFSVVCAAGSASAERETSDSTPDLAAEIPFYGNYHALIIGIDEYKEWPSLKTAVKDSESIQKILVGRYGFSSNSVVLRTNGDATGSTIINDLRQLAARLGERDNLLIYFTGTGRLDELTGDGYWIPVEGDLKDTNTWISHSVISRILSSENVKCKHILVIADSCYAETFSKESIPEPSVSGRDSVESLTRLASLPSRQIIATGGIEPYMDGPRGGHSLFGEYLIQALSKGPGAIIDLENICRNILRGSGAEATWPKAHIGRFKTPADRGGRFVLFDRKTFIEEQQQRVAREKEAKEREQLQALLEERKRLEAERVRLEEEKKALEEKKNLEAERNRIEKENAEKDRVAAEQRKAQEQLNAVLEERKKLEAERRRLEAERAALEEKTKLEAERIKIEKAKIEKAKIAEERRRLEEEAARLEAEKRLLKEKEKLEDGTRVIEKSETPIEEKRLTATIPKTAAPRIILRSKEQTFNFGKVRTQPDIGGKILNYDEFNFFDSRWNPNGNFVNDFVDNGDGTITDRATGLMWEKGGSDKKAISSPRTDYVKKLNRERFAGYTNWRVPTLEELASLLELKKNADGLHIAQAFSRIEICASVDSFSDIYGNSMSLSVDFREGRVMSPQAYYAYKPSHIKAVRSITTDR